MTKIALHLSKPILIAVFIVSAGSILLVGLLCGLVARPNNCIDPSTTTTTFTASTTNVAGTSINTVITGSITTPTISTRPLPSLTTSIPVTGRTTLPSNATYYRLSPTVQPSQYTLLLQVDYDPFSSIADPLNPTMLSYTGQVVITISVNQSTSQIALHVDQNVQLTDTNPTITNLATNQLIVVTSTLADNYQIYRINLATALTVGTSYNITMNFRSTTTSNGFYYHGYTEPGSKLRSVLGTRFTPNLARTAFPCFDEPGFKARFIITIEHPNNSIALSNSPVDTKTDFQVGQITKTRTVFQNTFVMSTYLVGWAVVPNDFGNISMQLPALNTIVTVYGRASEINVGYGNFALEVVENTLTYLATYSGVTQPIPPKIDLIALPFFPDFSSPSWGLNGFNEDDLFYLDSVKSKKDKQLNALTIAKEISHLWFGNYITCNFWDDAWIQEGLAVLFQYRAIDNAYPDWDILNQFLVDITVPVMWFDGYESSLPLKYDIDRNVELNFLFTDLLSKKSAALMKMWWTAYGETTFKAAISNLLTNQAFGTVDIDIFSNALTAPANWSISSKQYIEPWVIQHNLPEVILIYVTNPANNNTRIIFVQERFLLVIIDGETSLTDEYLWPVYLECRAGGTPGNPTAGTTYDFSLMLSGVTATVDFNTQYDWVKCNKDFNGYYITQYDRYQFTAFETVILNNLNSFSVGDRVNLLHNSFELAWLSASSYSAPSMIAVYLGPFETNLSPWKAFFYHVDRHALLLEHRESFRNLRGYANQAIVDAIARFGFDIFQDSSNHTEELLKIEFAFQLGRLQHANTLNEFTTLFKSIDPVYFISPDNNLNNILDDMLFSDQGKIPIESASPLLAEIGLNPTGRYYAWYYIREYWGEFFLRGADMRKLHEAMQIITSSFDNDFLLDEIATFFLSSYDFDSVDLRLRMLETGINNLFWAREREDDFMTYFFELPRTNDE